MVPVYPFIPLRSFAASVLLIGLAWPSGIVQAIPSQVAPLELLSTANDRLAQAEKAGDLRAEHAALRLKVQAEQACGLQAEVLRTSLRALDLAKALGDARGMAVDLRDLSMAFRVSGQLDKAEAEARNALAMALPLQDDTLTHELMVFLMDTHMQGGHYTESLRVGEDALRHAEQVADDRMKARIWLQVSRTMLAQHKYSDALPFLTKAARVLGSNGTDKEQFLLQVDHVKAMIGIGRLDQAEKFLADAVMLAGRLRDSHTAKVVLHLRYELASAKGASGEALAYLQRIKVMDDSLHYAQVAQTVAALQVMHAVDQHENDNAALRAVNESKEATIAEVRLGNHMLLVLVAILVVLSVALVLTSRYSLRMVRRMKLKNEVIREQHDQIHAKNLELMRQNMRLSETLVSEEEKEVMIREIHHRIKNNLQIVDSLLGIQMGHDGDPQLERQFREAQGRIRSMALVHETIYKATGSHKGPLRDHLEKLSRNILVAFGAHDRISVQVDVTPLDLPEEVLLPLTLLVNELLTNSIKYAFVGRDAGHIHLVVRPAGDSVELLYSDDGVGTTRSEPKLGAKETSFGMELVGILARQLNGELRNLRGTGTALSLVFRPEQKQLRKAS